MELKKTLTCLIFICVQSINLYFIYIIVHGPFHLHIPLEQSHNQLNRLLKYDLL